MSIIDKYKISTLPLKLYTKNTEPNNSFLNTLENKFSNIIDSIHESERVGMMSTSNKADLHTLVTSFSAAETNLRILTTINEKLISSLQEILRMQI